MPILVTNETTSEFSEPNTRCIIELIVYTGSNSNGNNSGGEGGEGKGRSHG